MTSDRSTVVAGSENAVSVSVVIPCYNGEAYIANAIRSALSQSRMPAEVIVVDDGSVDRSGEVAKGFGGIVRVVRTPNRGSSHARTYGASLARGDFVKYVDADDELMPGAIERQTQEWERLGGDLKVIVYGDSIDLYPSGERLRRGAAGRDTGRSMAEHMLRHNIQTSLSLYPRGAFVDAKGFNERVKNTDEYEFNFRLALLGYVFVHTDDAVVTIRQHDHPDRIAVRFSPRRFPEAATILAEEMHRAIDRHCEDEQEAVRLRELVDQRVVQFGADHFWAGRVSPWASHLAFLWRRRGWKLLGARRLFQAIRTYIARLRYRIAHRHDPVIRNGL